MTRVPKRLALVFAHPDDDTFGVGGTVALHAGDGLELMTVLATSGEAGPIADPSLATRDDLARVREGEARASYRALGMPRVDLRFLRYPDMGLAQVPVEVIVTKIVNLVDEFRPHVMITFGPEGVTAHEDHMAIHRFATEAFHRARERAGGSAFHRLLYSALPESRVERFQELQRMAGMEPFQPWEPFAPRGVPDELFAVEVDTSSVWRKVADALREHRTQAEEMEAIPGSAAPETFGKEFYVQAWPQGDPPRPMLRDVFEGLPEA